MTRPVSEDAGGADIPNLPLLDDSLEYASIERKPTWRGWIHAATFPVAIATGVILVVLADGAAATWASAVFMTTSLLLFGISATYHRFPWSPGAKRFLKRLDHANIFLLIAGTYTPIAVIALPPATSTLLLTLVWTGAGLGILFRIFFLGAPRWLYVPLYILLGVGALGFTGDLLAASVPMTVLVLTGGAMYVLGAVFYALKRPNPAPGRFGFHELFHALTVLAYLCHWTGILVLALNPPSF
ncbi:hemolysin III [Frigoribacterium sp. Leaf263]|uniref:PAQR family membrane homeostasis protein TrhA n=1 Tax=Frigoribacterium sp. Leaf263 TaxID=1736313 RepID=UPI0006F24A5C|nr:hemolysin III family protein [Frigoribacterium sp. Leaf263]KQO84154.1 hemolysin III [Frigoribacterium sp. Leaf263]